MSTVEGTDETGRGRSIERSLCDLLEGGIPETSPRRTRALRTGGLRVYRLRTYGEFSTDFTVKDLLHMETVRTRGQGRDETKRIP